MSEQAELHPAYQWDCPECGHENFARAIVFDMPDDEKLELLQRSGELESYQTLADLGEGVDGDWMSAPESVTCEECDKIFPAFDQRSQP